MNEAASGFGLSGRTYVVTGAGRSLGRAMALAIAAAGGVVAVARTEAQLKETAALDPAGHVIPLPADVSDIEHADQLIARARAAADLFADPDRAAWVLDRVPMGRLGDPADLAGAVVFPLSPASGYITGQLLPADGGWLAG